MKHCPLCERPYGVGVNHRRRESRHHIFPRKMYPSSDKVVHVCQECHDEFNLLNPYTNRRWSKNECVELWVAFCDLKGKRALDIYPELVNVFCTQISRKQK